MADRYPNDDSSLEIESPKKTTFKSMESRVSAADDLNQSRSFIISQTTLRKRNDRGDYEKAFQHFEKMAYRKKLDDAYYEEYVYCGSNYQIKEFGVGIFFFIEFVRRLVFIYFFMAIVSAIPMAFNLFGKRLEIFLPSYNQFLSRTTIGNLESDDPTIVYWISVPDSINVLIFLTWLIFWRWESNTENDKYYDDPECYDPRKFTLVVDGFNDKEVDDEQLRLFFNQQWPCYQASVVYDCNGKLMDFKRLQSLENQISTEELKIRIGEVETVEDLEKMKLEKVKLEQAMNEEGVDRTSMQAYVHLQHAEHKKVMMAFYNKYNQLNSFKNSVFNCVCCCCRLRLPQKNRFRGQDLRICSVNPPHPQEIYWENVDTGRCSRMSRTLIVLLFIVVLLIVSCGVISVMNLYVNSSQNCTDFNSDTTLAQAKAKASDQTFYFCYCNINIFKFDTDINIFCQFILSQIYLQNVMQIMAAVVSGITNTIFAVSLKLLIPLMRPQSKSLTLRLNMLALFLAIFINTIMIPLFLNSSVYGVFPARIMSFIFDLSRFKFYSDFTSNWYYYIGPYFMNFMIFSIADPFIQLLLTLALNKLYHYLALSKEEKVIQKELDQTLSSFTIDVPGQLSNILLLVFLSMCFSTGMPVLNIICFVSLGLRYCVLKYLLFYYSVRVQGLNETVNTWVLRILPFALVLHVLFGIWMITAPDIFPSSRFSDFRTGVATGVEVVDRYMLIPFMLALIALVLLYMLIELLGSCLSYIRECLSPKAQSDKTYKSQSFEKKSFNSPGLLSYDIHKNDDYMGCAFHFDNVYTRRDRPQNAFQTIEVQEQA